VTKTAPVSAVFADRARVTPTGALANRQKLSFAISVSTITMEGDANGAPHPEPAAYAKMCDRPRVASLCNVR
jgi:hypothetical protein